MVTHINNLEQGLVLKNLSQKIQVTVVSTNIPQLLHMISEMFNSIWGGGENGFVDYSKCTSDYSIQNADQIIFNHKKKYHWADFS